MGETFKSKIRMIGTSFGLLIPSRMIKANKIKLGEEIEVALLKRRKLETIENIIGIAKGAAHFKREALDRV